MLLLRAADSACQLSSIQYTVHCVLGAPDLSENCWSHCTGDWSEDRLARWRLWPLLLGLTLWSPVWSTAVFSPAHGDLINNMNCLSICSRALAAAVPVQDHLPQVRCCACTIAGC